MIVNWSMFPLLRIVVPFILGILLQYLCPIERFGWELIPLLCLTLLALRIVVLSYKKYWQRFYFGLIIQLVLFLFGYCYTIQFDDQQNVNLPVEGKSILWVGEVHKIDTKKEKIKSIEVGVRKLRLNGTWHSAAFKFKMLNPDVDKEITVSDYLFGSSTFLKPKNPIVQTQFNYAEYLYNQGITYQAIKNHVFKCEKRTTIAGKIDLIKKRIYAGFKQYIFDSQCLAVLSAIVLGDKSEINHEVRAYYSNAGVMHVLAVSGLHVGIVYLLLNQLFGIFGRRIAPSWLRFMLILVFIWAFAALTGFSASVQRAALMFTFVLVSQFSNRKSNIINSICGSALLIVLMNPFVIYQIGFQLSYAAVIGIVLIYPKVYSMLTFKQKLFDKLWSLVVVSLAAQIATLPITLFYFHQFPNYFLVSNILVIPFAFLIVTLSLVFCVVWLIFQHDFFISYLLNFFLFILNEIVEWINEMPFSLTTDIFIHSTTACLILISIVLLVVYLYAKNYSVLVGCLTTLLVVFLVEFIIDWRLRGKMTARLYAVRPQCIVFTHSFNAEIYFQSDTLPSFVQTTIEDHLFSEGHRNVKWYNVNDNDSSNVVRVTRANDFVYYRFKDFDLLHSLKNKVINKGAQLDEVDVQLISRNVHLSAKETLVETPSIIFDSSVPVGSSFHKQMAKKFNANFLNKKGYVEFDLSQP